MSNPSDPVASIYDLVYEEMQEGIVDNGTPRASGIARFAAEVGCDFQDVVCRRAYIRIFTRQEVWRDYGRVHLTEWKMLQRAIGYYFDRAGLPGGEGYYKAGEVAYWQAGEEAVAAGRTMVNVRTPPQRCDDLVKSFEGPERVPDDWQPKEAYPGYEFVDRDHPEAVPVWVMSM